MDCVFCKIINGEIPSKKIFENNDFLVIMDIHPQVNGHLLVIPKKHYSDYREIDDNTIIKLNELLKTLGEKVINKLDVKGLTFAVNYGDKQDVKHFHLHILPNDKKKIKDLDMIYDIIK